ncbi:Sac2 family-domain-containing protein [Coniella lustricola]|uniref:Sac2 family-domain-containing protein n=1 Tax=Coniella lustricola TaxID=2025994 RepID=A0A2T3A6A3_9PEZI|nr:Sac2 family-domain-containing protein [Coniella lustricola]
MWLDRLGHNAPPSGFDSRPISPLPRRVSGRGGPGTSSGASSPFYGAVGAGTAAAAAAQRSARGSTTSLVSSVSDGTGSTTSLLLRGRGGPNGSGSGSAGGGVAGTGLVGSSLRQSHTLGSAEDGGGENSEGSLDNDRKAEESVRESLAILAQILGEGSGSGNATSLASAPTSAPASRSASPAARRSGPTIPKPTTKTALTALQEAEDKARIKEEDLELDVDFGGLSLREYLAQEEQVGQDMIYRPQTVEEYHVDKTKYEELHRSILACDNVLTSVETNLSSFRNDLAAVSADIESLQARSQALNVRLENRQALEKRLSPLIEELSVSPHVVSTIAEGHVDEAWVKALAEVDRRSEAYDKAMKASGQTKAMADLGPLLEKLRLKAIERIRDHLVAQIKALRSPHINAQIIQQQNFLRFRDLYAFLHKRHAALADEICQAYRNTMRWYYLNQFTRYQKALDKIKLHVVDRNDVLGHEDTSRKATLLSGPTAAYKSGSGGGGVAIAPPHDAFNLGRRIDLLKSPNQAAISSYLAEEDTGTHYLEVPFRNFNLALVDNATAEYTFLTSFFSPALSLGAINKHFSDIFEPTFSLGHSLTKHLVGDTLDGLGVLLCIRLNQHFAFELQRRRVPAMDSYVNGTTMALWPRLQNIMDAHCESVRSLTSSLPSKPLPLSTAKTTSAAPHVATQRFAQLVHGILALCQEAGDDEPVVTSLGRLRSEMEAFLTRYSQAYFGAAATAENVSGAGVRGDRKRERFLYNNYSLICTILGDAAELGGGKLAVEQVEHFEGLKRAFQEAA